MECGLDSSGLKWRQVAGSCEHDNEPSGSVRHWEFLEWMSNCWLFRKDSVGLPYSTLNKL
jgi:hypothetical protein